MTECRHLLLPVVNTCNQYTDLSVVEYAQFVPYLLRRGVYGPHAVEEVHRLGQIVSLWTLRGVRAGPQLAPSVRQHGPRVRVKLNLRHGLENICELHWQCEQAISKLQSSCMDCYI